MALCSNKRSRNEDPVSEDEEEMVMMLVAYCDTVMRAQAQYADIQSRVQAVIHDYVKFRGGMQEVRVFEIPQRHPGSVGFVPESIEEKLFVHNFRFSHAQMDRVVLALLSVGVPAVIKTQCRDSCPLHEALAMMCMKYAWPTRLGSMVKLFRSSTPRMSRLVGHLRRILFNMFVPALNSPYLLPLPLLTMFSDAIQVKSGSRNIVGFIDGTVRPIPKPTHLQGAVYNGKDRVHALKYQAFVTPDGMLHQLAGPWPGSRHDMHMLHRSELVRYMLSLPPAPGGGQFSCYADQGYAQGPCIETPYFDGAANAVHEAYNQAMASSRIAVEWAFGDILALWASQDFKRSQQLLSNRKIGQVYLVAGLLTNFMNCFQPGKASQYFKVPPPAFEAYMAVLRLQVCHLRAKV